MQTVESNPALTKHLVVLRGPVGAGKTSIMRALSERMPHTSAVEIDALKRMIDPTASSPWRRQVALDAAGFLTERTLGAGRSVVTETHTRWPEETEQFREIASHMGGVAFSSFLIVAPFDVCLERASARTVPDIHYAIDEQMVLDYYTNVEPLLGEHVIDTSVLTPDQAVEQIMQSFKESKEG